MNFFFDTGLPAEVLKRCADLAVASSDTLGCRDLGRVDLIVDEQGEPTLLEINTLPGFTDVSLLPDAARQAGIAFPELVDKLVKLAAARAPLVPLPGERLGEGRQNQPTYEREWTLTGRTTPHPLT